MEKKGQFDQNQADANELKETPSEGTNVDENTAEAKNEGNTADNTVEQQKSGNESGELEKFQAELAELKDKYIRLVAEFDNFRKRTAKERIEIHQSAGKDIILSLLDVLDDCDRAEKQFDATNDGEALKEGSKLIFAKLRNILFARGLKPMESIGREFDTGLHEAITAIPAPNEEMKGKVMDEVQKGYMLNDVILRYAKVVVGN